MKTARLLLLTLLTVQILGASMHIWVKNATAIEDFEGFVYGEGTFFEIHNSPDLNLTLTSTEAVRVLLRSGPGVVSLVIESNRTAASTALTFEGFEACKTYYRYQDSCLTANFTTDPAGRYTYTQDISEVHKVLIQEVQSTIYINADGTVSPPTAPISVIDNIYTFTNNIYETIAVRKNDIIIDGDGYILQGGPGSVGLDLGGRSGVTVRNIAVRGSWFEAISLWSAHDIEIRDNDVSLSGGDSAILLVGSDSNNITGNTIRGSNQAIGPVWGSKNNIITGNTICDNYFGVYPALCGGGNKFYHNNFVNNGYDLYNYFGDVLIWDDGYPSGGNYWSGYSGCDVCCGPAQDQPGCDGIGDTPCVLDSRNVDHYPFMREDGWVPPLEATVDIDPDTLNLISNGQWITAYITIPEEYPVGDVEISMVALRYDDFASVAAWGEVQDGVLMVKFDRAALRDYLGETDVNDGDKFYDVTLTIAGQLADGTLFEGIDTITVKRR